METATGVAIGLSGFAAIAAFTTAIVKSYIGERTKARRATDQPVTLGEMSDHCEVEHTKIGEDVRREIVHVKELVQKDLDHGSRRFDVLDKKIDQHSAKLDTMSVSLQEIALAVAPQKQE